MRIIKATLLSIVIIISTIYPILSSVNAANSPKCALSDDAQLTNPNLILSVFDDSGGLTLEDIEGKRLLYLGDTSDISFQVDGITRKSDSDLNSYITQPPTIIDPYTISVKWEMSGIDLTINYELIDENLEVTATINNYDSTSHQAGLRFLLDTMLGANDGAPLYAPNIGVKTYEIDILNPTFNYWKSYDFYPNPTFETYGTLITIPDRIVFAHWPKATSSLWDYTPDPNQRFYISGYTSSPNSDSSVLMYYNPILLEPGQSRKIIFSYGLSANLDSWKSLITSELDNTQNYLLSSLSSSITNYAQMMSMFNSLGVDKEITIFEDSASEGVFGSTDWKSNVEMLIFNLKMASHIDTYVTNGAHVLRNINPATITQVPQQLGSALSDAGNAYKWGWVTRNLKFSGAGLILSALSIGLNYYEGLAMEDAFAELISFNDKLSTVYYSILNNPADTLTIRNALYEAFGNDVVNQIESKHDQTVKYINALTLPSEVDPNYFLDVLRGINKELSQVNSYQRNIVIAGEKKISLPDMNSYRILTEECYNAIVLAEDIHFGAEVVGGATALAGLALSPTGAAGAACWIVSLVSSSVGVIAKSYALVKEQTIYNLMFEASQCLFQLSNSLPLITSEIHTLATSLISSSIIRKQGEITNIQARNEWNWDDFRYDTFFDTTIHNSAPETSEGYIVFHVRSLDQELFLANMDCRAVTAPAGTSIITTLQSMVHFSWWGGNYEARVELWLGPLQVSWKVIDYNVGIGGGIESYNIIEGVIEEGTSQNIPYDTSGNSEASIITLNYGGSEINLHAYDTLGNHLGINYTTGLVDEQIPGAQYSGNLPTIEWIILPPGYYFLEVVCISADIGGENYTVSSSEFQSSSGILDIYPRIIYDSVEQEKVSNTTLIISEIGSQNGLANVTLVFSNLVDSTENEIEPYGTLDSFNLQAGEAKLIPIQYSIPLETPLGEYQGEIAVTATELGSEAAYEEIISVNLEVVEYTDSTSPIIGEPTQQPYGDVYSYQSVAIYVDVQDSISGVKNVTLFYSTDDGYSWTELQMVFDSASGNYFAYIPEQTEGTQIKYKIVAYDNAGNLGVKDNQGEYYTYSVILEDITPPTGSIIINGGAATTSSLQVTLTLSAIDSESDVYQMRFSNDGNQWSIWESYDTHANWILPSGYGTKTIYVQFKNGIGLESSSYLDTIIYETTPPAASFTYTPLDIQINEVVTFDASASYDMDGIIVDYFWNFGDGTNGNGETVTHIYPTDGSYTVILTVTDNDGLTYTVKKTLDSVIPEFPVSILVTIFLISSLIITIFRKNFFKK